MTKQVLFLCSGNYYRSRYAEIFFNSRVRDLGLEWIAVSRGLALHPDNIGPLSKHAAARLEHHGLEVDAARRLPRAVTLADFLQADRIIALKTAEHRAMLERAFPSWVDRTEYWDIHDLDCESPESALPKLEAAVIGLLHGLARQAA